MCAGYGWPTLVRRGLVPECGGWAGRRCAVATPAKAGGCARDPRQPRRRRRAGGHLALPRLRPGINITALPDTDREYRDTTQPARRSMGFSFSISILRFTPTTDNDNREPSILLKDGLHQHPPGVGRFLLIFAFILKLVVMHMINQVDEQLPSLPSFMITFKK